MLITLIALGVVVIAVSVFMQQPKFGSAPSGERLKRIEASPNYKNGKFQNLSETPSLAEGHSYFSIMYDFMFNREKRLEPEQVIPAVRTDLHNLGGENQVVWFGHSSILMKLDGKTILVDPVFSKSVSPLEFMAQAFSGADAYAANDMPDIDYLFITHDHWDHLDYHTIKALMPRVKQFICPLGVGAHLEHWGVDVAIIQERDWNETIELDSTLTAHTIPSRHFSGRGFTRDKTLWCGYLLQSSTLNIFISGDGGYDTHFSEVPKKYGQIDVAILENGQYDEKWKYIHMLPNQVLKAAHDLGAKTVLPVHWSKFAIADHSWDDPLAQLTTLNKGKLRIATPKIGEVFHLNDTTQVFSKWWRDIK